MDLSYFFVLLLQVLHDILSRVFKVVYEVLYLLELPIACRECLFPVEVLDQHCVFYVVNDHFYVLLVLVDQSPLSLEVPDLFPAAVNKVKDPKGVPVQTL